MTIPYTRILHCTLTALSAFILLCSCNKGNDVYIPEEGGGGGQKKEEETADYSKLTAANHPRVIMTEADVTTIKNKLSAGSDANLSKIHKIILAYADSKLNAADLQYKLTSNRLLSVSSEAAARIACCSYAYRLTGEQKYLERAEKDMKTVCNFSDWHSAAHFLDGAEMAYGVGIGYDWLYKDLSTETKNLAVKAITDFAFYCALNGKWNLNFYTSESNWNQVCNGGLVVAALAIYEANSTDSKQIIEKAVSSNKTIMKSLYNPDGNYPEGYGYWAFGTSFECLMLSAMESCLGTDFSLSDVEGFKKTGKWIMFMEGMNGLCFNYCDCDNSSDPMYPQWYLANKFNDPSLMYVELRKLSSGKYSSADGMYMPMVATYASRSTTTDVAAPSDHLWTGAGINPVGLVHGDWTFSNTDVFLGLKAGKGSHSHGHLDAGSFVFDAQGVRWSADLGLQSYGTIESVIAGMGGNFSDYSQNSMRWDVFRYNNYNHSTLTINDAKHKPSGTATITSTFDTDAKRGFVCNMTPPLSDQLSTATRTIYLENGTDLVIEDNIGAKASSSAKVRWTMVTMASPKVETDRIVLTGTNGNKMQLTVTAKSGGSVELKTWSTVGKSYDAANTGYYECGFESKVSSGSSDTFTVRLTPVQ